LGPHNQYEALSYNNLGCSYFNEGKHEESINNHNKALHMYENLCGDQHYKLIFALNQMAYAHKNLG
jgi:tetratricopeptide (TPR) repeat protein